MKKYYLLLIIIVAFSVFVKAQYSSQNISLLGHWYNPSEVAEPVYGIKYNGICGWIDTSSNNTKYAIIGSSAGTHFIDISAPSNPIERDYVPGRRDQCIWREYKTYGKYVYAISDDDPPNSFQIIDMSYLPDSVHVVHDTTTIFDRAHTLYIDGDKLYCASVTNHTNLTYYSMAVYSLANPEVPTLLRSLDQDDLSINTVHDMFVRNDTVYASCGFQGLFIYKFNTGTNTFSTINSFTSYPDQGYNHSSALTQNGRILVFCDEVPDNMAVKAIDVSDLQNISVESIFKSNEGATPHNPYIVGNKYVVIAYYQDGLQIVDISNPAAPVITGYFDTDTLKGLNDGYINNPTYHGNWGAYLGFSNGLILTSDMQNGLYIFNAGSAMGIDEHHAIDNTISVYPNPVGNTISISLKLINATELVFEVFDITGRKIIDEKENVFSKNSVKSISMEHITKGAYVLKISGKEINYSYKIIKN